MTLLEYMNTGNEVVTDKINAYVDKDVFNNLLKMSYASLELIAPANMVTVYTDTVLAVNKYKYDTLLASAAAEFQSGLKSTSRETHSGTDTATNSGNSSVAQSGTNSSTVGQSNTSKTTNSTTSTSENSGTNSTEYGHIVNSTNTSSGTTSPGTVTETNKVAGYDSAELAVKDSRERVETQTANNSNGSSTDTNSGTDKITTSTNGTITATGETNVTDNFNTTTGGETTSNSTTTTNGTNSTEYGHIISTEKTDEFNSPEYIAAMRAAASFSLAKIIAVDITAAICAGVW